MRVRVHRRVSTDKQKKRVEAFSGEGEREREREKNYFIRPFGQRYINYKLLSSEGRDVRSDLGSDSDGPHVQHFPDRLT